MFQTQDYNYASKEEMYENLLLQAKGLMEGEKDTIANLSNVSSLLFLFLSHINWAGFYLMRQGELVLGPFQGKPACIRIQLGRGVCGTAAKEQTTQCIEDVHAFEGHIPCDSASNSEIVIPLIKEGRTVGVLDIDSPEFSRFDSVDQEYLETLVGLLIKGCDWDRY